MQDGSNNDSYGLDVGNSSNSDALDIASALGDQVLDNGSNAYYDIRSKVADAKTALQQNVVWNQYLIKARQASQSTAIAQIYAQKQAQEYGRVLNQTNNTINSINQTTAFNNQLLGLNIDSYEQNIGALQTAASTDLRTTLKLSAERAGQVEAAGANTGIDVNSGVIKDISTQTIKETFNQGISSYNDTYNKIGNVLNNINNAKLQQSENVLTANAKDTQLQQQLVNLNQGFTLNGSNS